MHIVEREPGGADPPYRHNPALSDLENAYKKNEWLERELYRWKWLTAMALLLLAAGVAVVVLRRTGGRRCSSATIAPR